MKTIPEIRTRLIALGEFIKRNYSDEIGKEIITLAEATKRREAVRTSRPRQEFTEEKRQEVILYAAQFPDMSYHELSLALDVNTARISETLAGVR